MHAFPPSHSYRDVYSHEKVADKKHDPQSSVVQSQQPGIEMGGYSSTGGHNEGLTLPLLLRVLCSLPIVPELAVD